MWQEINIFLRDSRLSAVSSSFFVGLQAVWFTVEPDPVVFTLFGNRQLSPLGRPGLKFRPDGWELAGFSNTPQPRAERIPMNGRSAWPQSTTARSISQRRRSEERKKLPPVFVKLIASG
jgi:hypothetical protein